MKITSSKRKILKIAEAYFNYLGSNYPTICLSDEFYLFPRAKKALRYSNHSEDFDKDKIIQDLKYIKNLKHELEKVNITALNLEERIDYALLNQSICGFLREFGQIKIWQNRPSLYIKIAILGIEGLLYQEEFLKKEIGDSLILKLRKNVGLLSQLRSNVKEVSPPELELSVEIAKSASYYFRNLPLNRKYHKETSHLIRKICQSLKEIEKLLRKLTPSKPQKEKEKILIEKTLKESFSYNKSLKEVFDLAFKEYKLTLEEIKKLSKKINKKESSFKNLLCQLSGRKNKKLNLLELYTREIEKIKNFLRKKDILDIRKGKIIVREVPLHLKPLRASASYNCWAIYNKRAPGIFYINPQEPNYQEYIFITAHEAYPGHHLLDSRRKDLKNFIRTQVESPLFYEGWASFAEELIEETGYLKDPHQEIIGLRRRAWRATRAVLDIGLRIGKIKISEVYSMLKDLGYPSRRLSSMIKHYLLMPGYQLCYTIGKLEFQRLKKKYSSSLGLKNFLEFILNQGEIPFCFLEEKLKEYLCQKNS